MRTNSYSLPIKWEIPINLMLTHNCIRQISLCSILQYLCYWALKLCPTMPYRYETEGEFELRSDSRNYAFTTMPHAFQKIRQIITWKESNMKERNRPFQTISTRDTWQRAHRCTQKGASLEFKGFWFLSPKLHWHAA